MSTKHHAPLRDELRRRLARPQRHRLLQGYPMAPVMRPAHRDPFRAIALDSTRPLIIGILPHTFCNPKVRGCGFCTFPHEKFSHAPMQRALDAVEREITERALHQPTLRDRRIEALYLGGGTANLTPPDRLEHLCALLASTFAIGDSELTLEGVPRYFLLRDEALLDVLARAPVRHRRISMGVQTFDPAWLARMGRDAFGDRADLARLVDAAHHRGFTASADLLFNLPGASLAHALADVRTAIDLGFDQICIYNLVLTADLDTEWARDDSLLRAMPDSPQALTVWLALRQTLLEHGYHQTTLTNFERAPRFRYEPASFTPATYDALGFGPGAISTFTSHHHRRAIKWLNARTSDAYARAIDTRGTALDAVFQYTVDDLRLLHLTRGLARLAIDRAAYTQFFGTDPVTDFPAHFTALEDARLLRCRPTSIELTPEGMFYADAVAGLLAHQRLAQLRTDDRAAHHYHMG